MRWFKHLSNAQNDENMSELMDKFGAEGYGVWWLILERIAQQMDKSPRTFLRLSVKVWAKSCRISAKNFQKLVTFLEKKEIFLLNFDEDYLTINCPNLAKYRDEWSNRKDKSDSKTRELLGSHSGQTPATDTDTETQTEEDIEFLNRNSLSGKPDIALSEEKKITTQNPKNFELKNQAIEILNFLNEVTGKKFRPSDTNLKMIMARLKSGATVGQCHQVIAKKRRQWSIDEKMSAYLRPATLFNATKFEQYLGELG